MTEFARHLGAIVLGAVLYIGYGLAVLLGWLLASTAVLMAPVILAEYVPASALSVLVVVLAGAVGWLLLERHGKVPR